MLHRGVSKCECSACLRLQEVQSRIRECKELLDKLYIQEAYAQSSVNTAHDPIICYLPLELVSKIFMLSNPNPAETDEEFGSSPPNAPLAAQRYQFSLGAVCTTWRNIVRSTPQLWTEIYIQFPIQRGSELQHREFLLLSLQLSGSLPLYIQARETLQQDYTGRDYRAHSSLLEVLNNHSDRWNTLDLCISPLLLAHIKGGAPGAPNLKHLWIHLLGRREERIGSMFQVLFGLPSPQIVKVSGITFSLLGISWKYVTEVELGALNMGECWELLQQATQLVDFDLHFLMPEDSDLLDSGEAVTALKLASWKVDIFFPADELFSRLVLPSLASLDVSGYYSLDNLVHLFSRSMCPLRSLSFSSDDITPADVIPILEVTPLLRQLVFAQVTLHGLDKLFDILARMKLVSNMSQDATMAFLPHLEEFSFIRLSDYPPPWHLVPSLFPPTRYSANSPYRLLRKVEFRLSFDVLDVQDHLDKDVVLQILEIQQRSYDLNIWNEEDGTDIDLVQVSYEYHFRGQSGAGDDPEVEGEEEADEDGSDAED